ncbi:MAG: helix-turn-helix domain-containing protein [Pseudomonadota bacterium]
MPQNPVDPTEMQAPAKSISVVANYAIGRGVPVGAIEEELGISYLDLLGEVSNLPIKCINGIWRVIDQHSQSTEPGVIEMAKQMPLTFFTKLVGGIDYAQTVREAFQFFARNSDVLAEGLHFQLDESMNHACLSLGHPSDSVLAGHANQATIGLLWRMLCSWAEQVVIPQSLHFMHGWSGPVASYNDFFKTDIMFDQPKEHSTLTFDREILDIPVKTANSFYFAVAVAEANERAQYIANPAQDLSFQRVRDAIADNAAEGVFSVNAAAVRANMSERTAQRYAARHGASLQDLVQSERAKIARERLTCNPETPLSDLALDMGYSDERAFRRAFRQWTGLSPRQFKALAKGG